MSIFAITFRISDETSINGSYEERYQHFVETVRANSVDYTWEETTSFILIKNDKDDAGSLAREFENMSLIDPDVDLAVVIDLSTTDYSVIGSPQDRDIEAMMSLR